MEQGRRRDFQSMIDLSAVPRAADNSVEFVRAAAASWFRASRHRAGVLAVLLLVPAPPLVLALSLRQPAPDATALGQQLLTPQPAAATSAAPAQRNPERNSMWAGFSVRPAAEASAARTGTAATRGGNPSAAARVAPSLTAVPSARREAAQPQKRIRPAPAPGERVASKPRKRAAPSTSQPETPATATPAAIPQAAPTPPAEAAQAAAANTPAAPEPVSPPATDREEEADKRGEEQADDDDRDVAKEKDEKDEKDSDDRRDRGGDDDDDD